MPFTPFRNLYAKMLDLLEKISSADAKGICGLLPVVAMRFQSLDNPVLLFLLAMKFQALPDFVSDSPDFTPPPSWLSQTGG